jgi:hypothetical protein
VSSTSEKTVYVRKYERTRFAREESVVDHWRRRPSLLTVR